MSAAVRRYIANAGSVKLQVETTQLGEELASATSLVRVGHLWSGASGALMVTWKELGGVYSGSDREWWGLDDVIIGGLNFGGPREPHCEWVRGSDPLAWAHPRSWADYYAGLSFLVGR